MEDKKEKHKCEALINYNTGTQILTKIINGYDDEYCECNAKYFENGHWFCGKHAPSLIAKRESDRYFKWKLSQNK